VKPFIVGNERFIAEVHGEYDFWFGRIFANDDGWYLVWSCGPDTNQKVCSKTYQLVNALNRAATSPRELAPVCRQLLPVKSEPIH
jgi:hypothetical protein